MAIFASTTLGSSDPSRALSIKALEARAQALAAQQAKQETPTSLPSPWQGAGYLANTFADALGTRRADQAAAQRRQDLAGYIAKAGDNPTMADVGQITAADSDVGRTYLQEIQQRRTQAAQIQAQKEAAAEAARVAETAEVAKEARIAGRPKSSIAEINADAAAGRMSEDERREAIKKLTAPAPAERKAGDEQEDKHIELQATATGLKEARGLLDQPGGVYSGAGAGAKEFMGRNLPGVGAYVAGTDKATTERTNRYNQIVNAQALDLLSQLKGASSDKDMAWAIGILNDKNADIDTKKRALDVLIPKVEAHRQASEQRLRAMGREPVKVETPPPASGAPAAGAPAAPAGGGGGDLLEQARKAIAAGAPKDKVIERLKQQGVDATGL